MPLWLRLGYSFSWGIECFQALPAIFDNHKLLLIHTRILIRSLMIFFPRTALVCILIEGSWLPTLKHYYSRKYYSKHTSVPFTRLTQERFQICSRSLFRNKHPQFVLRSISFRFSDSHFSRKRCLFPLPRLSRTSLHLVSPVSLSVTQRSASVATPFRSGRCSTW